MNYDAKTAEAVMEAMDGLLKRYLSADVCNEIWNELVRRFPLPPEKE